MYLALFLTPWMIVYAISTIAMQHRMPRPTTFIKEQEETYGNTMSQPVAALGGSTMGSRGKPARNTPIRLGTRSVF